MSHNPNAKKHLSIEKKLEACRYAKEFTTDEAGLKFNCGPNTIREWMRLFGIKPNKIGAPLGNQNYRGGRICPVDAEVKIVHRANSLT